MKNSILLFYLFFTTSFINPGRPEQEIVPVNETSENLFIILLDGIRWQEIFRGADSVLINQEKFTPDTATLKSLYWAHSTEERRKKLMPFFWNVLAAKGQLFGNRDHQNKMDAANLYAVSYPGYSEIFTGTTDITITGNQKKYNRNINVLEWLNTKTEYEGKVAVFSSWDVFPYILNNKRNGLMMNSGYEPVQISGTNEIQNKINLVQEFCMEKNDATRHDLLTYVTAKDYIRRYHPRVVVIGFGETDDFAHQQRYDLYLQQASMVDRMISELWHFTQITPAYKNKTSFIITTDHGRGSSIGQWSSHGMFIRGSSQTWLALAGPGIEPLGERKDAQQMYNRQLANLIAQLSGTEFFPGNTAAALQKN